MALAIDASTPALATANSGSVATTGSFTPPVGAVLCAIGWHDTASGNTTNTSAISDSQSLGWTIQATRNKADSGGQNGHVQVSTAVVGTSTSMTVTSTGTNTAGAAGVYVLVITGADTSTPIDVIGEGSSASAAISIGITTVTDLAWAFLANIDWNVAAIPTVSGTETQIVGGGIGAGPDDRIWLVRQTSTTTPAGSVTMSSTAPTTGNVNNFIAWAFRPASTASIPPSPLRTVQGRDPGETWWIQRDRRDANTVATAANPLPAPLDSAWQSGSRYWHLYADSADAAPRAWQSLQRNYTSDPSLLTAAPADPIQLAGAVGGDLWRRTAAADFGDRREVPQQRAYVSDPLLLTTALVEGPLLGTADTPRHTSVPATHAPRTWTPRQPPRVATTPGLLDQALLEGALIGGAETAKRNLPATHVDRRLVPQQPLRSATSPGILDQALLENELLGGADTGRHLTWFTDRREVPQQRPYISDPSFYPTVAPTDPLTVAWGAGGTYWLLYNVAAVDVDRREVPQQRRYVSDPGLLATALLENEFLGGSETVKRHLPVYADRREYPTQRAYISDPVMLLTALLEGVLLGGSETVKRHLPATHVDRREVPAQRQRVSDPLLLATALLENELLGGGDTARHAMWFTDRRWPTQQRPTAAAPDALADVLQLVGDLWRRYLTPATHMDRRQSGWQPPRWQNQAAPRSAVVRATSAPAVNDRRTSASTVTDRRTSSPAVNDRRTSMSDVEG